MRPFLYHVAVKKFSLPKIQLPFKKKKPTEGPLWKISTKLIEIRDENLVKSRKNKKSWLDLVQQWFTWFRGYFRTVGWVFFAGIGAFFFFALFATPVFQLNPDKIEIVLRPEPVFDKNAIRSILQDFAGKNVFSISTQEVFQSLSQNIRHIASVEKTLLPPDGLRITITSFAPSYRAYIGEETFLLTENGQLISDIPEFEAPALQIHHLVSDPNLGKNTPIMIEDMQVLREVLQMWRKTLTKYSISALKFYDQEKEIHIMSNETLFILSLNGGIDEMKTLINLINSEQINPRRQAYIDLRIPGRIYTCAREEAECLRNLTRIYEG